LTVLALAILFVAGASGLIVQASTTVTSQSDPSLSSSFVAIHGIVAAEFAPEPLDVDLEAPEPVAALIEAETPVALLEPPSVSSDTVIQPTRTVRSQASPGVFQIRHVGRLYGVNITFYDCRGQGFCGGMYNGRKVYQGAAACSWNLPIGTRFKIVGDPTKRTYVCEDRGLLANTWVDVFWNEPRDGWIWQSLVGRYASIEVISLP
jgi:hypothetical protein